MSLGTQILWSKCITHQLLHLATATLGNCYTWQLLHLVTATRLNSWYIWKLLHLATATLGNYFTWKLLHLATATLGNCYTWKLLHLTTAALGNCYTWQLLHLATGFPPSHDYLGSLCALTLQTIYKYYLLNSIALTLSHKEPGCQEISVSITTMYLHSTRVVPQTHLLGNGVQSQLADCFSLFVKV